LTPQHRSRAIQLVQLGGGVEACERTIGQVDKVEAEWHAYVRQLKSTISKRAVSKTVFMAHE